ncbi:hypothetical protein M3212_11235 [Alkalihalobacillus oceani]|uniref:CBO0543 family protein n=1 Tax=Halalkalibacter oceani TaxID=1653776 RepID=UPI002042207D|nr:CBO0543 family protein [Halalkalibacter oceani]MCM3761356.1 hypothetical protein [Halalkalibacter oceani]
MNEEHELYSEIYRTKEKLLELNSDYWHLYSGYSTWYFWVNLLTILLPLVFLYKKLDRTRFFEISFYGYTAHVLWSNIDQMLSMYNLIDHPHRLTYVLPSGITITAVLFPVTFMLLYQYCSNRQKSFFLCALFGSILFSFGFGALSRMAGLLTLHKGMNLFYLFLIDILVAYAAYAFTALFKYLKKREPVI